MSSIDVYAECYANEFIAKMIFEKSSKFKIHHKRTFGRDRIIKAIKNLSEHMNKPLIAIIDYEIGLRQYVDKFIEYIGGQTIPILDNDIWFIIGRRKNIVLIIFDPNIEEALIYKLDRKLKGSQYKKIIKSSWVHKVLAKYKDNIILVNAIEKLRKNLSEIDWLEE